MQVHKQIAAAMLIGSGIAAVFAGAGRSGEVTSSEPLGVVELFTSQGCSSCPPADAAFSELAEKPGIVAVSYHVDYWNYRGWEDTLSKSEYSGRQYGYAKTLGHSNVYTPQAVLNGATDTRASDGRGIEAKLHWLKASGQGLNVPVRASLDKEALTIDVGAGSGEADIVIAYIKDNATVTIERGENAGATLSYAHVVVDLDTVGMWSGKAATIVLPAALVTGSGHDGCAIFLQTRDAAGNPGRILGAAMLGDYPRS